MIRVRDVLGKMGSKNINKWNLRGWKHEPKYSSKTLVGDWYEERKAVSSLEPFSTFASYTFTYVNGIIKGVV